MSNTSYRTIQKSGQWEQEIKKSRFICSMARATSESVAQDFIEAIQKEHWKANHNCTAMIIGKKSEIQRFSDNGEPSGTAGIPMLEVLKKQQLVNVVAVVTRYFGGTKLGSGGLIRAYTSSVSQTIQSLGIVEKQLQQKVFITIDYPLFEKVQHFLEQNDHQIQETQFLEQVTLTLTTADPDRLEKQLIDLLSAQLLFKKGPQLYVEKLLKM